MNDAVLIALIAAVPTTLGIIIGAVGKTVSYIMGLVQDKTNTTIEAKNTEIASWKELATQKDGIIEDLEERVSYLERRCEQEGVEL